jgi:hypothetical protein
LLNFFLPQKLRYFEQRGDKIMYYFSDKPEDMKQVVGWIDLTKMLSVERSDDSLSFFVRTTGRVYALAVPSGRTDIGDAQAVLNYWVGGLMRWKQLRKPEKHLLFHTILLFIVFFPDIARIRLSE